MRKYLAPLLLAIPFSCMPANSGKTEAAEVGDLSHPLADRATAGASLFEACGDAALSERGRAFQREPYLQQTTPTSTRVVWALPGSLPGSPSGSPPGSLPGSPPGSDAMTVEVRTSEGDVVLESKAKREKENGGSRYTAKLDGLEPDTVYCYNVLDSNGEDLMSGVGFRTAPADDSTGTVRFAVLGDSGEGSEDQAALLEQIPSVPFDFIVHVGDMAYESGTFAEFQKNYFDYYDELLRHFSVFPVPGNHEYETADAGPYRSVFDLPNNERWYSFDWGNVHFVALDTEHITPEQIRFLDKDLAQTDKPWTIAFFHRPPYSSGAHGSDTKAREAFSPILQKHDVSLVLNGHDHHYERVNPQGGIPYIVTGGGGAATYPVTPSDFTGFAIEVIHFLYITADDQELVVHAIDASGQEFDQLVLERK